MMRFLRLIKATPILIILLILLFFYMPSAIMLPPEVERNAIVSAVGIDKKEDKIAMSFLCFVPQANSNYTEKLQVLTCDGQNISENLQKASLILGRNVNLNHIQTIILSNEIMQDDVTHVLDFFIRAPVITRGCTLTGTNKNAEDAIKMINSLNNESGMKIEEILNYTENNYFNREATIDSFYSGYFSPTKTSFLTYIEILEDDVNGLKLEEKDSGGQSGGGGKGSMESSGSSNLSGEGSSSSGGQQLFSNEGKMVLLKEGKMVGILSVEEVQGLNIMSPNRSRSLITLKNMKLTGTPKQQISYEVVDNKTIRSVRFENGIPYVKYAVKISLDLYEVVDSGEAERQSIKQHEISADLKAEIEKYIKGQFATTLNILRATQTDVLDIYETLMKTDRKAFADFLETLEDKQDFLSRVVFAVSVDCKAF